MDEINTKIYNYYAIIDTTNVFPMYNLNYRCVDGVESRSELLIPSTQLGDGGVVMDSTKSFLTPSTKLDEGGVVMDITESRLFRGEPSPSGFHAMFTNL